MMKRSRGSASATSYGPLPAHRVTLPVMRQRWETLTFLHWGLPVEAVQRQLPGQLRVEPRDGLAWVGLVAFLMRVSLPVGPTGNGLTTFPETNLRTYVTGPDGRSGVWFFSLDAGSSLAVSAARLTLGLPYVLAAMTVERSGEDVVYRSSRNEGAASRASHDIVVRPGEPIGPGEMTEFDHYLTARFALWSVRRNITMRTAIEHPAWELRRADLVHLEQDLFEAAGLPDPDGAPIVHYSEGANARIGTPRIIR